jgi:hypothetical protein
VATPLRPGIHFGCVLFSYSLQQRFVVVQPADQTSRLVVKPLDLGIALTPLGSAHAFRSLMFTMTV